MIPLWVSLWTFHSSRSYCHTCGSEKKGRKRKSLLLTLNLPWQFCYSSWILQVLGCWASLFSLPIVLGRWWWGLGCNLHSGPTSTSGLPWTARSPLSISTRPAPLIHQMCHPGGALIRGNSQTTFSLFGFLGAGHSQNLFRVVQPPTELSLYGYC